MQGQREAVSRRARAEDWARLRCWRVFPGEDRQLRVLREWLKGLLPACMARDDVIAVASELGANAVCHTASGRGGQFSVKVAWTGSVISIVVGDGGGPAEPRVIDDPGCENGRGLQLVRALSLTVGVTGDERGRFVRADVPWVANLGPELHELAWDRETAGDLRVL
jgi:anti-sigma regulatory factor (Ser/Thr protein kinase)